ncbi:MAG: serine hydrolase [Rhodothermia bacterium]|nr:serine hydrolase [Rhodothermia bacterium]
MDSLLQLRMSRLVSSRVASIMLSVTLFGAGALAGSTSLAGCSDDTRAIRPLEESTSDAVRRAAAPSVEARGGRLIPAADSILLEAVSRKVLPGAVLLVTQDESVLHRKAYGYARLYNPDGSRLAEPEPMTLDHVFDLASLTKVFATTFAIMMLVDRGDVDLDAPVSQYLTEFAGSSKDSVLVRHLLTHTAGLYPWKPVYYHATSPPEAFDYVRSLPLAYPVGHERHYSDLGFMLLGYLVEARTGEDIDSFLRENVYGPLGLQKTMFVPREHGFSGPFAATSHGNPFERRMVFDDEFGYDVDEDPEAFDQWRDYTLIGEVNDGNAHHAHDGVAGHAGLFSTADDLTMLLQVLIAEGRYESLQLVSAETVREFLTITASGNGLGWAMSPAVLRIENPPQGVFGHTGFTGTYAVGFPVQRTTLVLLTNRQNLGVGADGRYNSLDELRAEVAAAVLDAIGHRPR